MKIIRIFAPSNADLYSFVYTSDELIAFDELPDNEELIGEDEFRKMMNLWNDPLYLKIFFEENKADLVAKNIDVLSAVRETIAEAKQLRSLLLKCANSQTNEFEANFLNLDNWKMSAEELEKQKIRGKTNRRWLRLYAIRVHKNLYVITGGAIKLTQTMQERPHTAKQLRKLEFCKQHLIDSEVSDDDTFFEFLLL